MDCARCGWTPEPKRAEGQDTEEGHRLLTPQFTIRHWIAFSIWLGAGIQLVLPWGYGAFIAYCQISWLAAVAVTYRKEAANLWWGIGLALYVVVNLVLVIYLRDHRSYLSWLYDGGPFYSSVYSQHEHLTQLMILQPFGAFTICLFAMILFSHKLQQQLLLASFVAVATVGIINLLVL